MHRERGMTGKGTARGIKKVVLIGSGTLALILAAAGLFIPLLPTTPFLLLCAFCYLRSSKRLYHWLTRHRIFGKYIDHYMMHRALPRGVKAGMLICLWLSLTISILLIYSLPVRILLLVVGLGVSIHLLSIRTSKREQKGGIRDARDRA